ncbi:MAG: hypothetical protein ACREQ4_04445, partial [Candidatus Binataceae bacterium]
AQISSFGDDAGLGDGATANTGALGDCTEHVDGFCPFVQCCTNGIGLILLEPGRAVGFRLRLEVLRALLLLNRVYGKMTRLRARASAQTVRNKRNIRKKSARPHNRLIAARMRSSVRLRALATVPVDTPERSATVLRVSIGSKPSANVGEGFFLLPRPPEPSAPLPASI